MKTKIFFTMTLMLLGQKTFATNVKDLAVNCKVQAKITQVYNIKHNPGLPPKYRFPGIPSSTTFSAMTETLKEAPGCEALAKKYDIYHTDMSVTGSISPATVGDIQEINDLVGQVVELKLNQDIGYKTPGGYLPLFPEAHTETLSFSFQHGAISGGKNLEFNLNWVYSLTQPESMTDIQKLGLAEKVIQYALINNQPQGGIIPDMLTLLQKLEPQQLILKKSYALLIWKMFKQHKLQAYYDTQIFGFHVGGDGFFYGNPLATQLNQISHKVKFSSAEIVQLLLDFPTFVLAGYSGNECLNFSETELEDFLQAITVQLPVLSIQEKGILKDPISQLAGKVHYVSDCTEGKVTEKAKALALEISEVLH